ncbi:glycosyltransferase [Oculatella sp. LEGE 06141]|uniref:glycosyltransferase family 2 protein n=1 Tax=Oculatella sp. LEGE 06141 TaxID=1828648 RepID=UPI0018804B1E|nr:glycosyltransferase [Oculatella sp. LEGE 06141]MBE9178459.1 glycosyltransferase [Oculatella sp. LEGE 06141]
MDEPIQFRATIAPVPDDHRPLWSVMIPTYNCATYLRETLASVLAQAPEPDVMQIEVVDDHSTQDDPEAVVAEVGQGRVAFYRQPENLGHVRNFETCLQRSRGHLIHLLHGDDCVRSGFYDKLQSAFATHPEIGAAFCRHILMDERGHWQDFSRLEQSKSGILDQWLDRIAITQRLQTPSMVVRREVYERLGGFDRRLTWTEDWEMWVRIAAQYPVWFEVEPLAAYRMHSASNTGNAVRTGENIRDVCRAIDLFQPYLPEPQANRLANQAREHWALYALTVARQMLTTHDVDGAIAQTRAALNCSRSPAVVRAFLRLLAKLSRQSLQMVGGELLLPLNQFIRKRFSRL